MIGRLSMPANIGCFLGSSLALASVVVPNRVVLAPMSAITDAPARPLTKKLGTGLVVSEMTACAGLVRAERDANARSEGFGTGIHIVQLAVPMLS
jgi:tRNA-dihydrouridine synthase